MITFTEFAVQWKHQPINVHGAASLCDTNVSKESNLEKNETRKFKTRNSRPNFQAAKLLQSKMQKRALQLLWKDAMQS